MTSDIQLIGFGSYWFGIPDEFVVRNEAKMFWSQVVEQQKKSLSLGAKSYLFRSARFFSFVWIEESVAKCIKSQRVA